LLSLQLVFVSLEKVYGTQEEKAPIKRTMSMIELPTEENFHNATPGAQSGPEPTSAVETSFRHREKLLSNLERLQAKFDSKTIQSQEGVIDEIPYDGKIIEIDISYPSFLNFINKRCQQLREEKSTDKGYLSKIGNLTTYIIDMTKSILDEPDKFYLQLFEEHLSDEAEFLPDIYGNFFEKFRLKFKEHVKNLTTQQRIKTLLILRHITDLKLNEDFGFGKLLHIGLWPSETEGQVTPHSKKEGIYSLHLAISPEKESDMIITKSKVLTPNTSKTHDFTYSSFLHELTHIYHYVIGDPFHLDDYHTYELMPISWKFDDVVRLFNPWYYAEPCGIARRLLEGHIRNTKEKYPPKIVDELLSFFKDEWSKEWTDLEEILTVIGIIPIDFCMGGKIVRYRVLDRQNESAEMNRGNGTYRLLYSGLTGFAQKLAFYLDNKFPEYLLISAAWDRNSIIFKSIELMLQALSESGYNLYAIGADIEQNSTAMQQAEAKFLKAAPSAVSE
nr:hypothetical protein [Alphaproteobacteria bacterium]